MTKKTLRSSSLPLFMVCSNAVLNPDGLVRVETDNEAALVGTLVHSVCETIISTGVFDVSHLRQRLTDSDMARANLLANNFLTVWREAAPLIPEPVVEWAFRFDLPSVTVTGHIDVHQRYTDRAYVIDWKTGRQHENHYHQMAAYAYGVWAAAGKPEKYKVYITAVYLEDTTVKPYEFTSAMLEAWAVEVEMQVAAVRYTVGRKCATCSLQDSCPAWLTYASNAKAMLTDAANNSLPDWRSLPAAERGHIVDAMYTLTKSLDRVRVSLRNNVVSRGSLDLGDGNEMTLVKEYERSLNIDRAKKVLKTRLPKYGDLAEIKLNAVLTAFAARAARGQKTIARKELLDELDKAGAIERTESEKMFRRPKNEVQMEVTK